MNGAPQPVLRASAWACLPAVVRTAVLLVLSTLTFSFLIAVVLHPAFWKVAEAVGADEGRHRVVLFAALEIGMALSWIVIVLRHRFRSAVSRQPRTATREAQAPQYPVPKITFEHVGGLEKQKEQILAVVRNRLEPERYRRYGVVRNGILLHGPRGTGKTYLAQATAGEFRLSFVYVRPTELIERWMGASEANIRAMFQRTVESRPALLFIDEIDSLGTARQEVTNDGGGAGRSYNSVATQLMQSIDEYRDVPGLVVMAATNFLDSVDPALTREGRFDVKLRVDLPDEATRAVILRSQLSSRPCSRIDLQGLAARTSGASAARLKGLVDRAAQLAADENRRITAHDLERAFEISGGEDRPLFAPVDWADVIVAADVEQELRTLVSLLNHHSAEPETPQGLLLVGAPGTGKSLIARLIATQTGRSFYPVTPADVLGAGIGQSVKRMRQIFVRARENAPSVIFLDEVDGLVPRSFGQLNSHDVQLTEQLLIEISAIEPSHRVFLLGATNDVDRVDQRLLRSGRLGEQLRLDLPDHASAARLIARLLGSAKLAAGTDVSALAREVQGFTPADIEAVCRAAKRSLLLRNSAGDAVAITIADFRVAATRVRAAIE
jgi:transitional endoplasmic reticulum ATPase